MFATQCSKPQRTNAEIGGYTARILPETWVALMPIQTATQTITLHRIPRKKTSEKLRETFVTAVFTDSIRRRLFGCVEQSFKRVPGTVLEQITLSDPMISREDAVEAAKLAGLHEVIDGMEQGYDTPCTDALFSQGQWQLLSIARAVAARPSILLLDEITANLDVGTEQEVLYALRRAGENRTVVSISHRLYEKMGGRELVIG